MFNIESTTVKNETDGVWTKFRGSEFLLASTNSAKFQRVFAKLQRPHSKQIDKKTLDPKIQNEIMCEALSSCIILDWKNVVDANGQQVAFDKDLAKAALLSNSEFRGFVIDTAADIGNYLDEDVEEAVK